MYKVPNTCETIQEDFKKLLDTIGTQSSQFFSSMAAPDFTVSALMSGLQHYRLRLQRFPTDQYDSVASVTARKLFNDLAKIAGKVQQPRIDNANCIMQSSMKSSTPCHKPA